ncbi:MAG: HlyD family efflux transporter periplasmic adaptor subunit [Pseudomonadales bacterium]
MLVPTKVSAAPPVPAPAAGPAPTRQPTDPLFRPEALPQPGLPAGTAVLQTPRFSGWLTLLLATLCIAAGSWLALGSYARKETVRGYLRAEREAVTLRADDASARVLRVPVRLGDRVTRGAPLVVLGNDVALTDGRHLGETRLAQIEQRSERLQRQRQQLDARHRLTRAATRLELQRVDSALTGQLAAQRLLERRLALGIAKQRALESLQARGAIAPMALLEQQAERLRDEAELLAARQAIAGYRRERDILQLRLAESDAAHQQQRLDLEQEHSKLREQADTQAGWRERMVEAPMDGIVDALHVQPGMQLAPGAPLVTVAPAAGRLQARLLIPSRAAGFVQPGQPVRLMVDAFPYQHFGTQAATLRSLSSGLIGDGAALGPVRPDEPVYTADAELARQTVAAYGSELPLRPGMRVVADIVLERRSLLAWLLQPWYARVARGS